MLGFVGLGPGTRVLSSRGAGVDGRGRRRAVAAPPSSWRRSRRGGVVYCTAVEEGGSGGEPGQELVVVAGATGRTGQLIVRELLRRGGKRRIRALVRNAEKARSAFGADERLELKVADVREKNDALVDALKDATSVICAVGSTALPSEAWEDGKSTPKLVVAKGVANIVDCLVPGTIAKVVLVSAVGTRSQNFLFKIFDAFGGAWSSALSAENSVIEGASEKGYAYRILHLPQLMPVGFNSPKRAVRMAKGDMGFSGGRATLTRETASELCVECIERDGLGPAVTLSLFNTEGDSVDWNESFETALSKVLLKLEFDQLDKSKFNDWLLAWGTNLVSSAALYPPLPLSVRTDPLDNGGVSLSFLRVSTEGKVNVVGSLEIGLDDKTLLVTREPDGRDTPLPGEKQVLEYLVESLDQVTT